MNYQNLKIPGYDIQEKELLGQGSFARVYGCKSQKQNEQNLNLCAKIMRVTDQVTAKREAEILNQIKVKHPNNKNLVKILEVQLVNFGNEQLMTIVMEKCQTDLKKICLSKKQHSNEEVLDFLQQILSGYQALFEGSYVHRDIKPENIMVNYENGKPIYKLADFGSGKKMEKDKNIMFQTANTGTPVYAPPEINQLAQKDDQLTYDSQNCKEIHAVDIFSIGMVLWQLLFGNFPFETTFIGITNFFMGLQKNQTLKTPQQSNINKDLAEIIEKMIVYFPSKRITYQEVVKKFGKQSDDANSRASTTTSSQGQQQIQEKIVFNPPKQNSDQSQQNQQAPQMKFGNTFPLPPTQQIQFHPPQQNQFQNQNFNNAIQPKPQEEQNRIITAPGVKQEQQIPNAGPNQLRQTFAFPPAQQNNLRISFVPPNKGAIQPQGNQPAKFNPVAQQVPNNQNENKISGFVPQVNPGQQNLQFNQPTSNNLRFSIARPNIYFNLVTEIKEFLDQLLDNSDLLKEQCVSVIQNSLSELKKLTTFNSSPQNIIPAILNLKPFFRFKSTKTYTNRQIRMLFILNCFFFQQDHSSEINNMSVDKQKQLLASWENLQ